MPKILTSSLIVSAMILLVLTTCSITPKEVVLYHRFDNQTWHRHDNLIFNIPVEELNKPYDVVLFARHTKDYEFDNLDFSMIMLTPAGEERIREYPFKIKNKYNGFLGNCSKDSCEASIALKKGMVFTRKGTLKIEIENLVPRLEVSNLLGVGIKLTPAL